MGRYGGLDRTISRGASQRRFLGFGGIPAPSLRYRSDLIYPTIDNLPSTVTINGQAGTTVFRYKGGDLVVSPSVSWPAWGTGETLSGQSSGDDPTPNDGSPLLGANDDSAKFNGGVVLQASSSSFADVTTEDMRIRIFLKTPAALATGSNQCYISKRKVGSNYWSFQQSGGSSNFLWFINASSLFRQVGCTITLVPNAWFFVDLYLDNSETTAANAIAMFINGANVSNVSGPDGAIGSLTTTDELTIGAYGSFLSKLGVGGNIAYVEMTKKASWFAGGAQNITDWAADHQAGLYNLAGAYPHLFRGTKAPTFSRSGPAFLRKETSGNIKYYLMGAGWPRVSKLTDGNGDAFTGIEVEGSDSEYCAYSTDISNAAWYKGAVTTPSSINGPLKGSKAYAVVENVDGGDNFHSIASQAIAIDDPSGKDVWIILIVSPKVRPWSLVRINIDDGGTIYKLRCYLNLSTGAVGAELTGSIDEVRIKSIGTHGGESFNLIRLKVSLASSSAGDCSLIIYPAIDNGDNNYQGDGSTCFYVAYAGLRIGTNLKEPSSPIVTTTATVTRAADTRYFKGDDGNLGGVGSDKKGSLFLKSLIPGDITLGANLELAAINDGGDSGDEILLYADTSGHVNATITASGGTPRTVSGPAVDITDGAQHKIQLTWQAGRAKIWVDNTGGTENTDVVAADIPDTLDRINPGLALISDLRCYPVPQWGVLS